MGKKLLCALTCMFAFSFAALAQETTGGIQGTVKDQQGAVISGATVTVTGAGLIGKKTATTDSSGSYHIEQLPPGTYSISASAAGFGAETQQNLQLQTGALPNVNFTLRVGAAEQTVEVSADAVMVDVTQSKVQTNVTEQVLQSIPKGRSFQSVIPFAPGARQEPLQGGRNDRTNGFQIDGASDSENVYMIDGVNNTNIQNGGIGSSFKDDFVQEVQIKSSSFEAEFGGALGGVINAVPKRGTNAFHGELKTYFQTSGLDANDPCASGFTSSNGGNVTMTSNGGSVVCGQRINPTLAPLNQTTRLDGTPEYYVPKKDNRHVIEPGYEVGGPILTDRLSFFSSYIPTLDTTRRTVNFTGKNPGPRTLTNSYTQHNMYNRLDYRVLNSVRLFGSWNYGYSRTAGQLIAPDSAYGQVNTSASTDPSTLRSDAGFVSPLSLYSFGGDWTPTSKLVVQSRFGYFFYNNESRGTPTGIRDIYDNTVVPTNGKYAGNASDPLLLAPYNKNDPNANPCSRVVDQSHCIGDIDKTVVNTAGFANMPSNFATKFDAFKRKSTNTDVSYFLGNLLGSHTFKTGYFWQSQSNDVLITANTAVVDLVWGQTYTPVTSTSACASIQATAPGGVCEGTYGYFFTGSNNVSNTGKVNATDQAFYVQDSWTVGRTGLTLNLGVRMDQEHNPAFDPTRFPDLNFGWGDKIAPRLGGAYDLLHNGKVKIYASYGKFFDIMKLGLTRGSFGSDYWHQCVYALDSTNYQSISPTLTTGAGCPASGPAPGVSGRFIENVDFRATKADPRDPAIQANMKPVQNHEVVAGVDWAISPTMSLETRYSRKVLDNTIEDMSITDNLGFYIGNPGSPFADVLHRPVVIPDNNGNNYLNTTPFCAECPGVVPAIRNYDGVEFRLTKQAGARWFGTVSYAYSRLRGNYAGLTNTDPTDGNGGRHSPNNGRAFDLPTMTYLPSGKIDDGSLATDRPHTAKIYGYYRLPWLGQETNFGISQAFFEGTPISACLPVVGTSSACQWAAGRGNMPILSRDPATGNIVQSGVDTNARTAPYLQTDFQLTHEIKLSKTHENYRLRLGGNVYNVFNQHSATAYYEFAIPANLVNPGRASRFSGDPGVDWGLVMNGYNYIDALNATGKFAGNIPGTTTPIQSPLTLANRYGKPQVFETARQIRLEARFTF